MQWRGGRGRTDLVKRWGGSEGFPGESEVNNKRVGRASHKGEIPQSPPPLIQIPPCSWVPMSRTLTLFSTHRVAEAKRVASKISLQTREKKRTRKNDYEETAAKLSRWRTCSKLWVCCFATEGMLTATGGSLTSAVSSERAKVHVLYSRAATGRQWSSTSLDLSRSGRTKDTIRFIDLAYAASVF